MTKRIGGSRRKARHKLSKSKRQKGKISLTRYFQEFKQGDNVQLAADPSIHKGLYSARFHGKSGKISGKSGKCYKVEIKDGNKKKTLIIHPVHLRSQ